MSQKNNIFSLDNLGDLPLKLKKSVTGDKRSPATAMIFHLFSIKNTLTISEILVGMYREFQLVRTRKWVTSRIHPSTKEGRIKRVKRGIYQLIKKGEVKA